MDLQCQYQAHILRFGKELFIYVYIYVYVHISEEFFSKTQPTKLGLTFETQFFGMAFALSAIWRRALHIMFDLEQGYIYKFLVLLFQSDRSNCVWLTAGVYQLVSCFIFQGDNCLFLQQGYI